jgi:hypothetical protein
VGVGVGVGAHLAGVANGVEFNCRRGRIGDLERQLFRGVGGVEFRVWGLKPYTPV